MGTIPMNQPRSPGKKLKVSGSTSNPESGRADAPRLPMQLRASSSDAGGDGDLDLVFPHMPVADFPFPLEH